MMAGDESRLDEAVAEETEAAPADAAPADEAAPTEPTEDEEAASDGPRTTKEKWREALDRYLVGDLRVALKLVDEILEEEPDTELRPRLERLKRRALDRLENAPEPTEETAEGEAEASQTSEDSDEGVTPLVGADESTEVPAAAPAEVLGESDSDEQPLSPAEAIEILGESDDEDSEGETTSPAAVAEAPAAVADPPATAATAERRSSRVLPRPGSGKQQRPGSGKQQRPGSGKQSPPAEAAKAEPAKPAEPAKESDPSKSGRRRAPTAGQSRPAATAAGSRRVARRPGAPNVTAERLHERLEGVSRTLRGMEASMVKIAEAYQRVAKDTKRKDQAYDQLYEELRQYKDNFLLSAQKPLFKDLILLFDGVGRAIRKLEQEDGEQIKRQDALDLLEHIRDEVLEVLYRRDIEPIEEHPEKLDIEIQKPVRRIDTQDPAEDRKIAQVVREGFRMNGVILRPQEVIVKRCVKEKEAKS